MKCRIEAGDLTDPRSRIEYRANWCQVMGLMQRCQRYKFCQRSQHSSIKTDGSIVFHASVDNAMSDANDWSARNQACSRGEDFAGCCIVIKAVSAPGALFEHVT